MNAADEMKKTDTSLTPVRTRLSHPSSSHLQEPDVSKLFEEDRRCDGGAAHTSKGHGFEHLEVFVVEGIVVQDASKPRPALMEEVLVHDSDQE